MAMRQCAAGLHFYNSDVYEECPSCDAGTSGQMDRDERKTVVREEPAPDQRKTVPLDQNAQAGQNRYEPTVPLKGSSAAKPKTKIITSGGRSSNDDVLPVAGWLVIVVGVGVGRDFRLVQGENKIGRNESNEVCLTFEKGKCDETVSGDGHAIVVYDNHANEFFVERGKSKNLPRVNGKTVRNDQDLVNGDILEVGQTKLKLVVMCTDGFKWP